MLNSKWQRVPNDNFDYPNITIYDVVDENSVLKRYEAIPNDGYVMYDTNALEEPIFDEYGMIIGYHKCYFTLAGFPSTYNFDSFSWVAVQRTEVSENYIF